MLAGTSLLVGLGSFDMFFYYDGFRKAGEGASIVHATGHV